MDRTPKGAGRRELQISVAESGGATISDELAEQVRIRGSLDKDRAKDIQRRPYRAPPDSLGVELIVRQPRIA